jgi:mono/diheme cytochrome c family protein
MASVTRIVRSTLSVGAALLLSHSAWGLNPGDRVDNFRLIDHQDNSRELYYYSDMKAVVIAAQGNGCDASQKAAKSLEQLRSKYDGQAHFMMVNSNLQVNRDDVKKEAAKLGITMPIMMDDTQLIGESLGFTHNGEVLVVNPQDWTLAYRGSAADAARAVDALVKGESVKTASTQVAGCAIQMPERERKAQHAQISYEKTIAPLLIENCVECHRQGGIGPWQMASYEMIRGFGPMIREVLRTQRMPPLGVDPHYQAFTNNRALSNEEMKTLVHWIEAGAPRGTGEDPLKAYKKEFPQWPLGEPDLVVSMNKFDVPATGVVDYQNWTIENPLDHDVWIRAVDFVPGDRTVLHHVIANVRGENAARPSRDNASGTPEGRRRSASGATDTSLANYVPGAEPLQIPSEAGIFLPKGAKFQFQMHYTPNGKQATDVTRMGLYFRKDEPQYRYRAMIFANPMLKIPPGVKAHEEIAWRTFDRDSVLYTVHPHSHFRGKAAKFLAKYPDGREEILINIPAYDFNWQGTWEFKEPKRIPAGTKVAFSTVYDNSTQNKANPDPKREVPWGEQTWDEMLFGVIRFRYAEEDGPLTPVKTAATN